MTEVLLVVHLLIALALIGVVLMQRSEGGALGIGGGGGGGGSLFSSRGAANLLTRTTAGLAAAFFVTSITLTILARGDAQPGSVFDEVQGTTSGEQGESGGVQLPTLPGTIEPSEPQVPASE